ncbi:MAG: 16S rRNA (guanine(966)-N(2))-methyltransferase RsmD [Caldilineae bacterium]|nr:MAG: 16S rRNA (guanine(966)-N(2))-methyltransferase RsmD [Caldilineae bacterium]
MRVIAGSAKGRKLKEVPGDTTRPITDRVKEALFSILGETIAGARVLDLFGGTGAVGIEALSRGAAHVTFVEQAAAAVRTIRHNLTHTRLADRATVIRGDAFKFLAASPPAPFDIIYIAPPQYRGLWRRALERLDDHPALLAPEGIAIAQIHPKEFEDLALTHLTLYDRRRYGSTMLCFYERTTDA